MKTALKDIHLPSLIFIILIIPATAALIYLFQQASITGRETPIVTEIKDITAENFATEYQTLTDSSDETAPLVIYDLRERDAYNTGHLDNTINLPYSVIKSQNFDLPRETRLVFYIGESLEIDREELRQYLSMKGIVEIEFLDTPFGEVQEVYNLPLEICNPRGEGYHPGDELLLTDQEIQDLIEAGEYPPEC